MSDLSPLLDALERDGYAITDGLIDRPLAESLRHEAGSLHAGGSFQPAQVGGGRARQRLDTTRTDHIHWLDAAASNIQHAFLGAMENLRQAINQRLTLGLFDLECHYACYAPGGYYRPHLDRFQNDSRRTLSAVFYLNDAWTTDDGGVLRLYLGESANGTQLLTGRTTEGSGASILSRGPRTRVPGVPPTTSPIGDVPAGEYRDVLPRLGTLALFLSDRYWHEVLPARRPRFAVTGWFRTRG